MPTIKLKRQKETNEVFEAKIMGGYKKYCTLMFKKHKTVSPNVEGKILVSDSYNGAFHKNQSSVISFSSQMMSSEILKGTYSAGISLNILTWMQIKASKKAANIFPTLKNIFKENKK